MNKNSYYSIRFIDDHLSFLDQTKLPLQEVYVDTDDYERIDSFLKAVKKYNPIDMVRSGSVAMDI